MTPDLQRVLAPYVESGWADASNFNFDEELRGRVVEAYLVVASDILVRPRVEVQVTTGRCCQSFRASKMVVAEGSGRFDLVDLKVGFRSQFTRAESLPLRGLVGHVGARPDLIHWPLDTCARGFDVTARAIIPDGCEEDHGAVFEVVLLGQAVL